MNERLVSLSLRASVLASALVASSCTKFASELDTPRGEVAPNSQGVVGAGGDADWSCLTDQRPRSGIAMNPARPLTYAMQVINLISEAPLQEVQARACFRGDVRCANPVTPPVSAVSDGTLLVTVYEGFDGYLEITSPGMVSTLLFFPDPWSAELLTALEQLPVSALPSAVLPGLAESARVQIDPGAGIVAMSSYDCIGPGASGVRFEIDTPGVPFVFVDRLPVAYRDVTSADGNAGFVNVPPGIVAVSAFPAEDMGEASVDTLLVRTGWVTSGRLLPHFTR
jgi:hypothetical protein